MFNVLAVILVEILIEWLCVIHGNNRRRKKQYKNGVDNIPNEIQKLDSSL